MDCVVVKTHKPNDEIRYQMKESKNFLRIEISDKKSRSSSNGKAVEQKPDVGMTGLTLGQAYFHQGKYDEAVDAFGKALAGKGGSIKPILDAQAHNYLGACYQQQGKLPAARDEFLGVMESGIDYEGSLAFAEAHFDEVMLTLE